MRYIKSFKIFQENADVSATSGMGSVSAAQPGGLPGTTGTEGSGDIGFVFKKEKRKKGNPSQVTDMRDLAPAKGVTHIEEIKESELVIRKRDPRYDPETRKIINDCLIELYDKDFELGYIDYDTQRFAIDLDDDETGYFSQERLTININKHTKEIWTGNVNINCKFDESGIISGDIFGEGGNWGLGVSKDIKASEKELTESEQQLYDLSEEVAQKLLGNLDYQTGNLRISWQYAGDESQATKVLYRIIFHLVNDLKED